jgi:CRISPR-associated protein Csd1
MILQALNEYYKRLVNDPDSNIPRPGYSRQGIHFCLVLDADGKLLGNPIDLQKDNKSKNMIVPQAVKRSVNIAANFLWDNTVYVLGAGEKGKPDRILQCFEAFKALQHQIGDSSDDAGMEAVLRFLDRWNHQDAYLMPFWEQITGLNLVFKLDGDRQFIHERPAVQDAWRNHINASSDNDKGMCLVTGADAPISSVHANIKGVRGTKAGGAALISFNKTSFTSFRKKQNYNAPVGKEAAFAYTTALNHLLAFNSRQKIQIGDAATVFWTERASAAEFLMAGLLDPGLLEDAPDSFQNDLRILLKSVSQGAFPVFLDDQRDNRFYILGLSPNAARVSVRFWHVSTVEKIVRCVGQHFRDLAIIKNFDSDMEHPPIWMILKAIALRGDSRNIPPLLAGQIMRSILTGEAYPRTLLAGIIGRIRADNQINYLRAAMLKAFLTRNCKKEITMSLDTESTETGYRLGRLFAVLEKAQEDAIPKANATIKDRFFGSASATPGRVFPALMRGVQNHIAKLRKDPEKSRRSKFYDIMIADILDGVEKFPPSLATEDQGLFCIGYYHQRKDMFTKKEIKKESKED